MIIASQNANGNLLGMTSSDIAQMTLLLFVFGSLSLGSLLGLDDMLMVHPVIPLLLDLVHHSLVRCLGHLVVPL